VAPPPSPSTWSTSTGEDLGRRVRAESFRKGGNPATIERLPENNERVGYLSPREVAKLKEACSPAVWLLSEFLMATGMRRGEAVRLTWKDINLETGIAHVSQTKKGGDRDVPLNERARAVLGGCTRGVPEAPVFRNSEGTPATGRWFSLAFRRACARAGVVDAHAHDLWHHAASMLVQKGVDLYAVAEILGHSQLSTTKRYAHLSPEAKLRAVRVLDQEGQGVDTTWTQKKGRSS